MRSVEFSELLELSQDIQASVLEHLPEPPLLTLQDEIKKPSRLQEEDDESEDDDEEEDGDSDESDSDSDSDDSDSDESPKPRKTNKSSKTQKRSKPAAEVVSQEPDLLGMFSTSQPTQQSKPIVQSQPVDDLLGIFGGPQPSTSIQNKTQPPSDNLLNMFSSDSQPSRSTPVQTAPSEQLVYNENGIVIAFKCHPGGNPGVMIVTAEFRNSNPSPVNNFNFLLAVPNYMQKQVKPASSNTLAPHHGTAKQAFRLLNQQHTTKPTIVKVKIEYNIDGQQKSEVFQSTPEITQQTLL